ncbi:ABC transporter permease subunit [Halorientalis regularis]|jgi:ABC-type transport system involved in multi-copper enzyme maturation permease subunit|uniref:ABC-2 type transport system permease protein n=1 Tax=Halorientalis regularis TaxID=660518 RepID=A0A1G7FNZ2_9EURY|nr:ABC transporter permease subunit [Halorientalis regularis]SDE77627.1 ABC-2 type transport system permease protein [Halorientalis regularis]
MSRARTALVVAQREFTTLLRTPTILVLALGFVVVVAGFVVAAGTGGYLPLILDLVAPMEILVPLLAFAFGYRAIQSDADRGELETIQTYPVRRLSFVGGVFLGRLAGLLPVVLVSLGLSAAAVVFAPGDAVSVVVRHGTVDAPVLFLRFATLTVLFTAVALAVAVAVSAAARSAREALAIAVVLVIALVLGFDATIVAALSGGLIGPDALGTLTALSPNSAYRGLVYTLAVGDVYTRSAPTPSLVAGVAGLTLWFVGALVVAVVRVWRG